MDHTCFQGAGTVQGLATLCIQPGLVLTPFRPAGSVPLSHFTLGTHPRHLVAWWQVLPQYAVVHASRDACCSPSRKKMWAEWFPVRTQKSTGAQQCGP